MKEIKILTISFLSLTKFSKYRKMMERTAPDWIKTSKSLVKSVWGRWKNLPATMRWKVEEMGRNSVIPSIMPRIVA